jgi:ABC-type histidine transport system ATPase subunit
MTEVSVSRVTIARGEVVVVTGPPGSGKTTLCRTSTAWRRLLRHFFQFFNLSAHKIVLENVMLGQIKVHGTDRKKANEKAHALVDQVGVCTQADEVPAQPFMAEGRIVDAAPPPSALQQPAQRARQRLPVDDSAPLTPRRTREYGVVQQHAISWSHEGNSP